MFADGMTNARDEPDEDDWPQTSKLHAFSEMEKVLSCGICKGFLTNPKELPCGHLYCAECISRSMDNMLWPGAKNECPTCRAKTAPGQCKSNVNIGKVVTIFKGLRKDLLELIEKDGMNLPSNGNSAADLMLLDSPVKPEGRSKRARGRSRKQVEDDESEEEASSSSSKSSSSSREKRGKVIERSMTFFSFGNKPQVKKIKEQLTKATTGSRESLRLDGDDKKLLSRYRNFVHLHNAQVDGGDFAHTLDEVVRKCNEDERIAERESFATRPTDVAMKMTGDDGFKNLIMAERNRKKQLVEPKSCDVAPPNTASSSTSANSSSGLASTSTSSSAAASPKEGKENDDTQVGASVQEDKQAQKATSSPLPKEFKMGKWHVVWSKKYSTPFFYDPAEDRGQLEVPSEVRDYFSGVDTEESMGNAVMMVNSSRIADEADKMGAGAAGRGIERVARSTLGQKPDSPFDLTSEAQEAEVVSEEEPLSWDCDQCTYRNSMNMAVCDMCKTGLCPVASKRTRAQKAVFKQTTLSGSSKKARR